MPALGGKEIGPIGFGLMGFTWRPEPTPYEQAFKTMKAALESGCNFWNGGEFYGTKDNNSLHLLHAYFSRYPEDADRVVLSIKGALGEHFTPTGDKAGLTRSIEECLKVLDGKKTIDIFECARVDPKTPIEETIGYLAEFVKAGKIGGIGLSETGAATIRRAASVHPIVAVEVEFSLFSLDIQTNGVASTCAELGIPIVAYSPLGKGFLTGQIKSFSDVSEFQKMGPRFQEANFHKNLELVDAIQKVAEKKGCTPAQLAIGWVKTYSGTKGHPLIIPLPGATTVSRVQENAKDVHVTAEDLKEIEGILAEMPVQGPRVPEFLAHLSFA
ncbi:Pyridoxal reductase [Lachnellula hyalina]|uniref:Pyridoxal reductase n=1 Tax=Lachnellula hyalina TaxID=1316788 RepID=A0A8H8QUK7_9HELO|nr:Pyridoxal reductase [Lachnellula hyalina]TVY22445.1 Pyridoxal reductase [Lachnellula hyalina]